jgi:hypothetical protein
MNIELLQKIINVINEEKTNSPAEFAIQLNISERMVYKYISVLKTDFQAPIKYCRKRKSYYFTEKGCLDLSWQK